MSLKEMAHAVYLGASVETVMPEGGNVTYWQQVIRRYIARHITGTKPRRRQSNKRRTSGKPRKRTNYASQVLSQGRATVELVDRVNGSSNE